MTKPPTTTTRKPFQLKGVESKQGHSCKARIKFKEHKSPPKFVRAKKQEDVPFKSTLDEFVQQRNIESQQKVQQQKQSRQKQKVDPSKAIEEEKRKTQQELQKLADRMGLGSAFRRGDHKTVNQVKKRRIAETGGGETVGEKGIAFDDGSAVFFNKDIKAAEAKDILQRLRK